MAKPNDKNKKRNDKQPSELKAEKKPAGSEGGPDESLRDTENPGLRLPIMNSTGNPRSLKTDSEDTLQWSGPRSQLEEELAEKTAEDEPTKEERRRELLFELLKRQMSSHVVVRGFLYLYNTADILKVLQLVKEIFMKEPTLVEMDPPCAVVGDIHGQYLDLMRVFEMFTQEYYYEKGEKKKTFVPGILAQKYVFLGDYIDRGRHSLEVIMLVFLLKILWPEAYVLLRGNHEVRAVNDVYGFHQDLRERFSPEDAELLWDAFNDVFAYMPLACIVGKRIFCVHGGISPHLDSLDDIAQIQRPLHDPLTCPLARDLLWSDPMIGLKGWEDNKVRKVGVNFGEDVLKQVMDKLQIEKVVRSHQMVYNGYAFFAERKLITIFTAVEYFFERENRGAILYIEDNGLMYIYMFIPLIENGGISDMGHCFLQRFLRSGAGLRKDVNDTNEPSTGHHLYKPTVADFLYKNVNGVLDVLK